MHISDLDCSVFLLLQQVNSRKYIEMFQFATSRWTWDQKHDREQHLCFLLGFTPVDRKRRSAVHFPLRQTWRFQLPYHKLSVPEQQHSIFASLLRFYLTDHTVCQGLLFLWMFYSKGSTTFIKAPRTRICQGTFNIVPQEVVWSIWGSHQT